MDSNGGPEKSLPGMGMPRWMKKTTERLTYSDICASPPTNGDGFLHLSRHRQPPPAASANSDVQGNVECYQKKKAGFRAETSSPEMIQTSGTFEFSKPQTIGRGTFVLTKQDYPTLKETSSFYKAIATTTASSTLAQLAIASQEGLVAPPKHTSSITTEVAVHGNPKPSVAPEYNSSNKATTLDTAMDLSKTQILVTKPKSSQTEMNNSPLPPTLQQLVAKANGTLSFHQPDDTTTPSATPTSTPTCSPQVSRRVGNPFFSGTQEKPNGGNWLFRSSSPGPSSNNKSDGQYDLKSDLGRSSASSSGQQKVRYVPRPSELRELNFWSPTSM